MFRSRAHRLALWLPLAFVAVGMLAGPALGGFGESCTGALSCGNNAAGCGTGGVCQNAFGTLCSQSGYYCFDWGSTLCDFGTCSISLAPCSFTINVPGGC